MGADRNQWQYPKNVGGKVIGWRDDGKGMENKDWVSPADLDGKQDHSANLDELAGVDPGSSGKSILALDLSSDVRNFLDVGPYVATRMELKALDTTKDVSAILLEAGRGGLFKWTAGDFSTQIAADTQEGIYVKATAIASSAGAWVRMYWGDASLLWFGAAGDGTADDDAEVTAALAVGVPLDGLRRIYKVNSKPASFLNIRNAAFKVGNVIYPSREYMRTDTAKITNGFLYTAWAQDKAYKVGTQLRVWVNEKESHADGTGRIALYFSDDGGATWSFGEYLSAKASGQTLWSAGFDGTSEYLFVRVPAGSTDVAPYTYTMWKRALGAAGSENYNGTWTKTNITFPVPSGFTGQPIMVHSFTVGHSSSIVVGASYGEGAAVMRSTDGGVNWTATILGTGSDFEEPTVRYHAASGLYIGFMRNGGSGEPRYWRSTDNLATVGYYSAATGYFGGGANSDSCVSFDVDDDGYIHAVTAYRNGVIEGEGTDERVSAFYLRGPVTSGNFWTDANTQLFNIGQLPRREQGGASALSQGSVIVEEDKVHLFYGMEERTGAIGALGVGNRVANIYQTVIFLDDRGTMFDDRADLAVNRAGTSQLRKIAGIPAWVMPSTDANNWAPTILSGRPNFARHTSTLTIASGVLTLTGTRSGLYIIDTEGAAATDDLVTITDDNAFDGDTIIIATSTSTRDVVVKNGTGNIICGADITLSAAFDAIMLMFYNGNWHRIAFGDNAV